MPCPDGRAFEADSLAASSVCEPSFGDGDVGRERTGGGGDEDKAHLEEARPWNIAVDLWCCHGDYFFLNFFSVLGRM